MRRGPENYSCSEFRGYYSCYSVSDHRPDLAVLLDGELTVFDLKVLDPISSLPADASERCAHVAFGNTTELGARERRS